MKRLFIDMDGVLAEYKWSGTGEEWNEGHFLSLNPQLSIVEAIRELSGMEEIELYILSTLLPDSNYCKAEKMAWLIRWLPEIPNDRWIFTESGVSKSYAVEHLFHRELSNEDYLLDDYTKNLNDWQESGGTGIKYLNGLNGTNGTWLGFYLDGRAPKEFMVQHLLTV